MIEEHWRPTGLGGILHCFTSTLEDARRGIEMGSWFPLRKFNFIRKHRTFRNVRKNCRLSKILIETDAPYLAPQPWRGKRKRARLRCGSSAHACECEKLVARRSCRSYKQGIFDASLARTAGKLCGLQSWGKELAWETNIALLRRRDF